ncbi:MAG TPA: DUF3459 domain-containing protein [Rhodothermales bacterium]|nr:DUF3459 domain-containing protein [Rhodothermales bacterium]
MAGISVVRRPWSLVLLLLLAPAVAHAQAPCASPPLVTDLAGGRILASSFLDSLTAQAEAPCVRARDEEERGDDLAAIARFLAATSHVRPPVVVPPPAPEEAADLIRDSTETNLYLRLRYRQPVLDTGAFVQLAADGPARAFAFARRTGDGDEVIVIVNAGDTEARLALPEGLARTPLVPIFASRGEVARIPSLLLIYNDAGDTGYAHPIPPRTAVVLRRAEAADVRPNGLHE